MRVSEFWRQLGPHLYELVVPMARYDFGHRCNSPRAPTGGSELPPGGGGGTGSTANEIGPLIVRAPTGPITAVAIAESSEVRGIYVQPLHSGLLVPVIEGTPVRVDLCSVEQPSFAIDRHDLTSGALVLHCLTGCVSKNEFDCLPVLVRDFAVVRIDNDDPHEFFAEDSDFVSSHLLVQAPRIRGVRHRAGVIRGRPTGANQTITLKGAFFRPPDTMLPDGRLPGVGYDPLATAPEIPAAFDVLDDTLVHSLTDATLLSASDVQQVEATDAEVLSVSFQVAALVTALKMQIGFIAPE